MTPERVVTAQTSTLSLQKCEGAAADLKVPLRHRFLANSEAFIALDLMALESGCLS